jgi:transposase
VEGGAWNAAGATGKVSAGWKNLTGFNHQPALVMNLTLTSVLKRVLPLKRFCYRWARWDEHTGEIIEIGLAARKGARACCGNCRRPAPGYDQTREVRRWQFISLWGITVFLIYHPRRVQCRRCGVRVEHLPWARGKLRLCDALRVFLAQWARLLSWKEVAERFGVSWADVYGAVKWVVRYGLRHRDLSGIRALGVDEVCVAKGKLWTLVYQIDEGARRLLWIGKDRKARTLQTLFNRLGGKRCAQVQFICSDMWRAYLKVIAQRLPQALHILDRFHIRKNLSEAIDQIRRAEAHALARAGLSPLLKKMRWTLLKHRRNWSGKERRRMRELLGSSLRSIRAFHLAESFEHFWTYSSPTWAAKFLDAWCKRVARSRLAPLQRVAKTLAVHRALLLNYFVARKEYSNAIVEGLNNKLKLTLRKSYGFRTDLARKVAIFHALGRLPEPQLTHSFF